MTRGTNLDRTRAYNRRVVLDALRRLEVASRTEIASRTRLSLTTVSSLVDELVRDGLLAPRGRRATARGQPPIEYAFAPGGAYGVGVAFDADHARGVLVDVTGERLAARRVALRSPSPDEAAACVHDLTQALTEGLTRVERARVLGLGVAVPGVMAPDGRVERMIRLPSWEREDLAARFGPASGLTTTVTNDAVAAALGEAAFGRHARLGAFFYALFALGMGSALVMDGRPHRGLWGFSGRFGHIPVMPEGARCPSCGGRGCLSLYASLEALRERLGGADDDEVARRFATGDPELAAWVERAADAFARAMLVLENLLDPDALILDGRLPTGIMSALAERADAAYAANRPERPDRARLALRIGSRGADAAAYGAAAVPIHLATAADLALVR